MQVVYGNIAFLMIQKKITHIIVECEDSMDREELLQIDSLLDVQLHKFDVVVDERRVEHLVQFVRLFG